MMEVFEECIARTIYARLIVKDNMRTQDRSGLKFPEPVKELDISVEENGVVNTTSIPYDWAKRLAKEILAEEGEVGKYTRGQF